MSSFYLKEIKDNVPESFENPILIVGMPGIANVGKNAVLNIIDDLGAKKIYEILYRDFPAQVVISQNGILNVPTASIYFNKNSSIKKDILLMTGDFQPTTPQGIYDFSNNIASIIKKMNIELVISTGAYMSNIKVSSPRVYVSGTSEKVIKKFLKYDNSVLMEVGMISGANGLIPIISNKKYGIEGVCLLAETNPIVIIDPLASKAIIESLNNLLNLKINVSKLDEQIVKMDEILDQIKSQYQKKKAEFSDTDFQSYIS